MNKVFTWLLWLTVGGAIGLFAFPLFPDVAKVFFEQGQEKIAEFKDNQDSATPKSRKSDDSSPELNPVDTPQNGDVSNPEAINSQRHPANSSIDDTYVDENTLELRALMLHLINQAREENGLDPVTLGGNLASQRHAENMLANGYISHWGLDGLKPYMRYTLAGGYNYEAENVSAPPFYINPDTLQGQDPEEMLKESMEGFMESAGHRRNILNKWHKKVNLGIAFNRASLAVVQQFEGDYIEFNELPSIVNGILKLSGFTKEGFEVSGLSIFYDPKPDSLSLGQLAQTYCYSSGTPAVLLRPPPGRNQYYPNSFAELTTSGCLDPYSLNKDIPPPEPIRVRLGFTTTLVAPPQAIRSVPKIPINVPWHDATKWTLSGSQFTIEADVTDIIPAIGEGVYTIVVLGEKMGEDIPLSDYALFITD